MQIYYSINFHYIMTKKLKKLLYRIIISSIIFILTISLPIYGYYKLLLFILTYLIIGYDILLKSFRNIINGRIFDENFLMTIATFGAFGLRDYKEAIAVMLFYQVGEFFQNYAVNRSRKSIAALMDIRPDYANLERNGQIEKVNPKEVMVGDIIIVKPGEKIPLDGIVISGTSSVDTSALTGESMPREIEVDNEAIGGFINLSSVLKIKVNKEFSESTISKILDLVENATTKKANIENFITRFARYYTPLVVIIATLLAILPPLLVPAETFNTWIYRAIVFLVISCPCALVISIPLSFFGGLGAASKCGILIKGSNYLEALAKTKYFVFDKTGTITHGNFKVISIHPISISQEELLEITAYAEGYSHHPIAESIKKEYGKEIELNKVKNIEELQGFGVEATINDRKVYIGNSKLMEKIGIISNHINSIGTIVYVAIDEKYVGYLVIADEIKQDSFRAIKMLNQLGIKKTIMLTGDKMEIANDIAKKVGIANVFSELLPTDKVEKIEELLNEKAPDEKLAFVGDGINDAPVLARADIGIAMGGIGSDAAIEAADIVIMSDELSKISSAIKISRKTIEIAKQNIVFAIGIKIIILLLGAFGYASIWAAVFADVGVSVIAILNSIRTLYFSKKCDL